MSARMLTLALGAGLGLAGCGGGSDSPSAPSTRTLPARLPQTVETTTVPPASTPGATASTPAPSATSATRPPRTGTTTPPESVPGGAGDEGGIRVPVAFVLTGGRLQPPSVAVPAFLRLELAVRNRDRRPHVIRFAGHRLSVGAGATAGTIVRGLRKGIYPVLVDGRPAGRVVTGAQPGP